jgi:hypothetical protein
MIASNEGTLIKEKPSLSPLKALTITAGSISHGILNRCKAFQGKLASARPALIASANTKQRFLNTT